MKETRDLVGALHKDLKDSEEHLQTVSKRLIEKGFETFADVDNPKKLIESISGDQPLV